MIPANVADLRRAAEIANTYVKSRILFVCIPVESEADHVYLSNLAQQRLTKMIEAAEQEEVKP